MFSLHVDTARTWRGGQHQVLLTVLGLRRRAHRAVLAAQPQGELYRRAPEGSDRYALAPRGEMDLLAAWSLARLLRGDEPDVIQAHDAHAVAIAALARSLSRVATPLVASRRVDFHIRGNAFSRWKYGQVDRFICASSAIRDMLIADGVPPERTTVVHEGIDIERIERAPPLDLHREFHLPAGCPVAGNVAALVPHKGQRHLIDAAARLVRDVPGARVLIVGAGELEEELRRQIRRLHLEEHVILTGFRSDVPSLLRGLDLFVMSSVTEGLGTSVLDAMAAGLAVVGTRAGGIPESVVDGETGLLAPPGDAPALARAMAALLRDAPRRRGFGAAGRRRAQAIFSAGRMVEETAAVHAAVARAGRAAHGAHGR